MNPFSLKSPQRPTITLTMPSKTTLRALSHTHPHSLTHKEPSTPLMTTVEKEEELTSTPSSSGVLAATTHHHLQEGHTALMNERYEEALHHYQRSIQIQPTSEGYYHLGNVYVHLNQPTSAIEAYHHSLDLDIHVDTLMNLANLYFLHPPEEDPMKALPYYQQVLDLTPHDAQAWFNIACLYTAWSQRRSCA
ncbi:hypothetical protein HMI55_000246, partial [Coelomomyces lativittatus]